MKNYIYITIVLLFMDTVTFGQSPNWSVNENDFQYTMSFLGFVSVDGFRLNNAEDKIAAFVNGECRGVTNLVYEESQDEYYAYLIIFSNTNEETVNFKIYDSTNNLVKNIEKTMVFEINEHYGNLFQAYSFGSPALNTAAEITEFGFKDVSHNDYVLENNQITIYLDNSIDVSALNALFNLSVGAKLFIGTTEQVSGENTLDFTNPVKFQVRSEDQSVLKEWTVVVQLASSINATYYKKDAVCYSGGAIKVLFTENEGDEVTLVSNGTIKNTKIISNGEAVFSNLESGTYQIKVLGNVKEININLKE